jgi:glycosyltransferase involved in cell wall biosynthesis
MILLIGNYPLDQQQSMQRFANMMLQGLNAVGIPAEMIAPRPILGKFRGAGRFVAKWLGYIDKFILFPPRLKKKVATGSAALVHICDHSNAIYTRWTEGRPVVITCHDLLAVRGALGEATDCPASFAGKFLQRWIVRGLRRANAIACVSQATLRDVQRLVVRNEASPRLEVVTLGLNYPYQKLPRSEAAARLAKMGHVDLSRPFILHVGSDERRKNREGVLRIFARTKDEWNGQLVFAGDPLEPALRSLGKHLDLAGRVVEVLSPESKMLEALYNCAAALVYPSRFEGFGWPVAEAQACGCPVVCSNAGPLPEVVGESAMMHSVDNEHAFAADILRLNDAAERELWSAKSLRNAERFSTPGMIERYIDIYRTLAPQL